VTNLTPDTLALDLILSAVSSRIRSIETKRKVAKEMLTLNYTVSKEDNLITVSDRLMLNEYQINNLMDSLVAHGYTVEAMSVAPATL